MTDVLIDPPDRGRSLVIVSDVAHEFAREIFYRGEDTTRNHVALEF